MVAFLSFQGIALSFFFICSFPGRGGLHRSLLNINGDSNVPSVADIQQGRHVDLLRASENGASRASGRRRGTRALGGGYKVNIGHGVSSAQLGLFIEVFLLCRDYMIGVLLFLFPRVLYGLPGMFSLQETLWSVLSGIARSASIGNSSS